MTGDSSNLVRHDGPSRREMALNWTRQDGDGPNWTRHDELLGVALLAASGQPVRTVT